MKIGDRKYNRDTFWDRFSQEFYIYHIASLYSHNEYLSILFVLYNPRHVTNPWKTCPVVGLCALKSRDKKNLTILVILI